MKLAARALSAAILLVASGAARAGADAGFYLGGALGQSKFKEWCDTGGSTITLASCEDTDTSWKLLGGYRFNRYVAAEATYIDWGEVTASIGAGSPRSRPTSTATASPPSAPCRSASASSCSARPASCMTEQETRRITPNPSTVDRDETELHYGLGAKYAFTRNWALRGEWENTDKLKVEMLSIGVEYRF